MKSNTKTEFQLGGLDCADCAAKLEKNIFGINGIRTARVDFLNARLTVEYESDVTPLQGIERAVKEAGYSLEKEDAVRESTIVVRNMDCPNESKPIEERLSTMPGVTGMTFNLLQNKIFIKHTAPLSDIIAAIKDLGFEALLSAQQLETATGSFWQRRALMILTVVSGLFTAAGIAVARTNASALVSICFYITAVLAAGYPIVRKGYYEAVNLRLGMNFLMSLAAMGAMCIGEWSEAAMVIFLFALAQLLESWSVGRARRSIQTLMELTPKVALRKTAAGEEVVETNAVNINDVIIIKPGERIPLDGEVTSGSSAVNQAPITGESLPVTKKTGDKIYAGSININGTLDVRVSEKSEDSTIARIIHLVEEAQAQKAPAQNFVERFARYYTPVMVALALMVATLPPLVTGAPFAHWLYRALVLLVISCPCALVISTPVTIVSGLTNAARNGILIKGGAYLENFGRLKVMAMDKTGTLTYGIPHIEEVSVLNSCSRDELLAIAASIESRSEHPFARAVANYATERGISVQKIEAFEAITGKGVRASLAGTIYYIGNERLFIEKGLMTKNSPDPGNHLYHSKIYISDEKKLLGSLIIADRVRDNATIAVEQLHQAGVKKVVMLTGDNESTAKRVASEIGIDDFRATLLPEEKVVAVRKLTEQYKHVAMVGDGINDAPALAAASIGISMGVSGTDTALETADIALMKDDLTKLAYLKRLSRKTLSIIRENIFIALFLKGIFLLLAVLGIATLWMAVFADMGASLMVVANGLRALKKL